MESSFTSQVFSTLFALAIVCGLAWVSLLALRKVQQGRIGGAADGDRSRLQFVHAMPVGAKERVVVMAYRGEEWVLGVSAGSVSLLGRVAIEKPASHATPVPAQPVPPENTP